MWFRNLQIYTLSDAWNVSASELVGLLQPFAFQSCSGLDKESCGWVPPVEKGSLVHSVQGQLLLALCTEKRLLPATVVKQVLKDRLTELEDQQGFKPGRKQQKELKEQVIDDLLPKAFQLRAVTRAWIDPANGWLVVDATSPTKADSVFRMLLKALDKFPAANLRVSQAPLTAMTQWLAEDNAPANFTVDQDAELRSTGQSKAKIRYVKHSLAADDLRNHIDKGNKQCSRLAMTWSDRISFVLTETMAIKQIKPLSVLVENQQDAADVQERFDTDFALMTGEVHKMMTDLVGALGGIQKAA